MCRDGRLWVARDIVIEARTLNLKSLKSLIERGVSKNMPFHLVLEV